MEVESSSGASLKVEDDGAAEFESLDAVLNFESREFCDLVNTMDNILSISDG